MAKSLNQKAWETLSQKGGREFCRKLFFFFVRSVQPLLTKLEPLLRPLALWKISREVQKKPSALPLVSFLFDKWGHLIRPKQVRWEITELTKIVEDLKPQTVLEIGTARGGTLFLFTRLATENATIVSLDLPWEDGGGYPAWRTKVYKKFATPKQKLHLLRANSHHQGTQERLREILEEKIDFLFIDGDHTYAGVKKDYEFYSPMVRIGGIIAFHDIAQHKSSPECQVDHFWNEIRLEKNFKELIATPPRDWGGIGVIFT